MVEINGQTLYQPYLAPATYCLNSQPLWLLLYLSASYSLFWTFTLFLFCFLFWCLVQFKALCLRMVTIWMCICPTPAWTLKPNWLLLVCCFLNLIYLTVRQTVGKIRRCVGIGTLNSATRDSLLSSPKPSKVHLNICVNSACITVVFNLKVHFYVQTNVSVWICLGCLYSAIRFLSSRVPPSLTASPALSHPAPDAPRCLDGKRQSDLKALQILKTGVAHPSLLYFSVCCMCCVL